MIKMNFLSHMVTEEEVRQAMLEGSEHEHLEFKEAKDAFPKERMLQYGCALANEGGGQLILGISDKKPRQIIGSQAFTNIQDLKETILANLRIRGEVTELHTPEGRVLVMSFPSRPIGTPLKYKDSYWMRVGEALCSMTAEHLEAIFAESVPDFSQEICPGARFEDLHPGAISEFRARWSKKIRKKIDSSDAQMLEDAELIIDGKVTYAALILLGTHKALGKYLACSETIFEYRSSPGSIPFQQRESFREGFLLWCDKIWELVNLRNDIQQFQDGLFRISLPTFQEGSIREAILNAIGHRDYMDGRSIFIRQSPRELNIESPGGFPKGITATNILVKQNPRNRRLAEALEKCGFIERSGQGADLMFRESLREGKLPPDFKGTDEYAVSLILYGQITDQRYLQFLENIGNETLESFSAYDFITLDRIHREQPIEADLYDNIKRLLELGIIEKKGRKHYMFSRGLYSFLGQKGVYTRKKGLDHETNKQLLLMHIRTNQGAPMQELMQVIPSLGRHMINNLLDELRAEGIIDLKGTTKAAKWYIK